MKKEVRRHLVEHAKTIVFIVREAHGAVSARLLETIFSRVSLQSIFGEVLGSVFADFGSFSKLLRKKFLVKLVKSDFSNLILVISSVLDNVVVSVFASSLSILGALAKFQRSNWILYRRKCE